MAEPTPVRLVFLCNAPAVPAGVEKTVLTLVDTLDPGRFDVRLVLNGRGPFHRALLERNADVEVIPHTRAYDPRWRRELRASLERRPADVVQLHLSRLNALLIKRHTSAAVVERLNMTRHGHGLYPLRWKWLDRFTARWIDRFIVVSESLKSQFVERGYPPEKLEVVTNGVDVPANPPPSPLREELGIAADQPLLGAVGRLTHQKGMDTFLRTAGHIAQNRPDAHFVIAGEGEERRRLERLAAELGVAQTTHFLGFRKDVPAVLSGLDVLLYLSRWEPFANTILEAMAVGTPVVASSVGGNAEAIQDEVSGRLVPPEAPEEAATAAVALLGDPKRRAGIAERGLERVRDFSVARMVEGHQHVYQRLAAAPR